MRLLLLPLVVAIAACASDDGSLTCGPGTYQQDDQCLPDAQAGGQGGGGKGGAGNAGKGGSAAGQAGQGGAGQGGAGQGGAGQGGAGQGGAGQAGAGQGGVAGASGSSGQAGAGQAGASGEAGEAGAGGEAPAGAGGEAGQAGGAGAEQGGAGAGGEPQAGAGGEAGAPVADRIQVQITQECREGGVKFELLPTSPFRTIEGYAFTWNKTAGDADFTSNNNTAIGFVQPNQQIHWDVLVQRPGYPDQTVTDVWSNTCAHDDNPTDCPPNNRDVSTNQEVYQIGDTFEAWLNGTEPDREILWYVVKGLSLDGTVPLTHGAEHIVATVVSFPIRVHAQPSSVVGMAQCHGWTERVFFGP